MLPERAATHPSPLRPQQVLNDWSHCVGGRATLIANNLADARGMVAHALNMAHQEPLMLAPNATHPLVQSMKEAGAKLVFGELDPQLRLRGDPHVHVAWLQPPVGLPGEMDVPAEVTVLDHGDSLPNDALFRAAQPRSSDVEIYGLHLTSGCEIEGALLVFNDDSLYERTQTQSTRVEPRVYANAARQLERLRVIAPQQQAALEMVWTGLQEAAGLPLMPVLTSAALAHGVAVQIPAEGSPSTFWMYARGENTGAQWLPELRPVHCAASSTCALSTASLERWLFVPVSPDDDDEAIQQAVLGIVKAAEHLGLRWRTDPARAVRYATMLDHMYGLDHDAYRPAFSTDDCLSTEDAFDFSPFHAPSCRIRV